MAGLPPTRELIGLKVPYGAWEPDTLITDTFGNPMFSVLDVQHHAMGSYEAIFGDENGHKLCYVKRRLITTYWKDGWDFCTYRPNFPGQPKYKERDMYGKSVYPFSFLQVKPTKCRYAYSVHEEDLENMDCHLEASHGWLGSTTICCTPLVRFGKWQMDFHRPGAGDPEINIDQSKNLLEVERGNDLLAALCIAYAFDKALCQPLVTIIGYQEKEHLDDDDSLEDEEYYDPEEFPALPAPERPQEEFPALPYEEREFVPDGYLEQEKQEPYGYLEAEKKPKRRPEPAGYLTDDPSYYDEGTNVDGYLGYDDTTGHNDTENPSTYLEDGTYDDTENPDTYLEDGTYDDTEGYTDDGHYLEDGTYDGDYTTDDSFHDEAPRR